MVVLLGESHPFSSNVQVVQEEKREIERENMYTDLIYLVQWMLWRLIKERSHVRTNATARRAHRLVGRR